MTEGVTVRRRVSARRLDDILTMVRSAFRHFVPPSGVLNETASAWPMNVKKQTATRRRRGG
jgi:hypothetical protein